MSNIDKIINLSKKRGFVFGTGEIYGGTRSAWDYGPLGVELKNNIKNEWWNKNVKEKFNIFGLDSSIILPTKTWEASGHLKEFTDPLIECKKCHMRFRFDDLQSEQNKTKIEDIKCPNCGVKNNFSEPKQFSGMMKTFLGPTENSASIHFLRPETAQGIFLDFLTVQMTSRAKIPFGIAQVGKAFRNEITPGNFIFRTREFEQMEIEFFVEPGTDEKNIKKWIDERLKWYIDLGISKNNLRTYEHPKEKLSHYSKRTVDIEYKFNFLNNEWGELEGIANRTDFDLKTHSKHSGTDLMYFDQVNNKKYIPYVIEPSAGLNRSFMAFLLDAYTEEKIKNAQGGDDIRIVLKLNKKLSPYKIAVLPLSKNDQLLPLSTQIAKELNKKHSVDYDITQAIGKRYRRQDEIGTPYCLTVDFDSLNDKKVTVRDRDTMKQDRVSITQLTDYFSELL